MGSCPRGSTVARPGVSTVGRGSRRRAGPAPPGKPDPAHTKTATGGCAPGVPLPGLPSPPLQPPLTLIFLLRVLRPLSPRGPTARRSRTPLMGGGRSTPTAHAPGSAQARRRRGSRLSHWPRQGKLGGTSKIARELCFEGGRVDGEKSASKKGRDRRTLSSLFGGAVLPGFGRHSQLLQEVLPPITLSSAIDF